MSYEFWWRLEKSKLHRKPRKSHSRFKAELERARMLRRRGT